MRELQARRQSVGAVGWDFKFDDKEEARQEMSGIRNSGIALAMGLLLTTPVTFAQAQTKESAHAFLASVINKGSTHSHYYPYVSYVGANCNSQLVGKRKDDRREHIEIDWAGVSAVELATNVGSTFVEVKGAIVDSGDVVQYAAFNADSRAMAERLAKAFEFLRVQCDKTKQFGF